MNRIRSDIRHTWRPVHPLTCYDCDYPEEHIIHELFQKRLI